MSFLLWTGAAEILKVWREMRKVPPENCRSPPRFSLLALLVFRERQYLAPIVKESEVKKAAALPVS
jgi:hypothetical protein